jgi:oligoribonuclease
MKFLSIDVETTGLDPDKDLLLEFAAVEFDTSIAIGDQHGASFRAVVVPAGPEGLTVPLHVLSMHSATGLWQELAIADAALKKNEDNPVISVENGLSLVACRRADVLLLFKQWLKDNHIDHAGRLNIGGKNVMFDMSFMERCGQPGEWEKMVRYRTLDPGILYLDLKNDDRVPGMESCIRRSGIKMDGVIHSALADAIITGKMIVSGLRRITPCA